jgi:hypothetical protein
MGKLFCYKIVAFICDAPARTFVKETVGHTSFIYGCERCNVVDTTKIRRSVF